MADGARRAKSNWLPETVNHCAKWVLPEGSCFLGSGFLSVYLSLSVKPPAKLRNWPTAVAVERSWGLRSSPPAERKRVRWT